MESIQNIWFGNTDDKLNMSFRDQKKEMERNFKSSKSNWKLIPFSIWTKKPNIHKADWMT